MEALLFSVLLYATDGPIAHFPKVIAGIITTALMTIIIAPTFELRIIVY